MSRKRNTTWRRLVAAYDNLRGRPPKTDYGLLIVLPMAAAVGGALIGLGMDVTVNRCAAARRAGADRITGPQPVPGPGRRGV